MSYLKTDYGVINILPREEIFENKFRILAQAPANSTVALTGGSTPISFYHWATNDKIPPAEWRYLNWTVSDERHVPHFHQDSNFGTASTAFLDKVGIPGTKLFPWPTHLDPHSAALEYQKKWVDSFNRNAFDICFIGMGEDGHTLSIFPNSPLLNNGRTADSNFFTAVEVPGKGWRLTLTPDGLRHCGQIHALVTGENKAKTLEKVLKGPFEPANLPIQILRHSANKVNWWVDEEAAKFIR